MKWNILNSSNQLEEIEKTTKGKQVLIYKHSNRCGICTSVKSDLEREWDDSREITPYYLDVVKHRDLSQEVARRFKITHESPQAILIENGKAVHHASHFDIRFRDFPPAEKEQSDA